ncbi:MAG: hypothetical protein IIT53_14590, partial [Fibrobacter sp.]|nr:hypothetical protein [Fibrobacter sp.]
TGTHNAILAFRNDLSGNLAYIDYNDGNLSITEKDTGYSFRRQKRAVAIHCPKRQRMSLKEKI